MRAIIRSFEAMSIAARMTGLALRRLGGALERPVDRPIAFHTWDVFGFDVGALQFRARWFVNHGRPQLHKDRWCWYWFAGPFEISSHRGGIL